MDSIETGLKPVSIVCLIIAVFGRVRRGIEVNDDVVSVFSKRGTDFKIKYGRAHCLCGRKIR